MVGVMLLLFFGLVSSAHGWDLVEQPNGPTLMCRTFQPTTLCAMCTEQPPASICESVHDWEPSQTARSVLRADGSRTAEGCRGLLRTPEPSSMINEEYWKQMGERLACQKVLHLHPYSDDPPDAAFITGPAPRRPSLDQWRRDYASALEAEIQWRQARGLPPLPRVRYGTAYSDALRE